MAALDGSEVAGIITGITQNETDRSDHAMEELTRHGIKAL
jgi:hypothetical protein